MATVRSEQILVESRDFKDLNIPLTRTSRLRYTSLSVSERLVALGSNTGGIYIFNKADCKLLQIAFAEKETAAVTLLLISPNEKFVAFSVCTGKIHVIDLKLDTRTKSETLRSVTDTGGAIVTCLKWDSSSTKLFIGDDMGKVTMVPVHTSKAKNLFSIPMEVIMKLDSAIVQIDKADDKLLVSTVTCCYLCNTSRDGQFGACFLSQTPTSSMIYCARPGSRIWEVDMEGAVLNTHQFKQLLAVAPLSILDINRNFTLPDETNSYPGQSVAFPKLKIISGRFILTWNSSSIYVLDPVNVRLILWTNCYNGILDVHCVKDEMYVYLSTMQVHCLKLMPVSKAIHTCMAETRIEVVARLCCFYGNILHRKHLRKHLGVADLYKIHNTLEVNKMHDLSEEVLKCIKEIENKVAMETDTDTSESGRSRSSSVVSSCSDTSGLVNDSLEASNSDKTDAKKNVDTKSAVVNGAEVKLDKDIYSETGSLCGDLPSAKMDFVMHNGDKKVFELNIEPVQKFGANDSSGDHILPDDNDKTIIGERAVISDSHNDGKIEDNQSIADSTNERDEVFKNGPTTNKEIAKLERGEPEGQSCTIDHVENEVRVNCDVYTSETNQHVAQNGTFVIENDEKRINFGEEFEVKEMLKDLDKCAPDQIDSVPNSHISSQTGTKYSEAFKSQSPARSMSVPLIDSQSVPNDDDDDFDDDTFDTTSLGDKISFGPRRPSLTSLSSFSSAEVSMDLPFPESEDQIAVQVKRRVSNKKKKKKRKSTSDIFSSNNRGSTTGSPLSLGSSKSLTEDIQDTTVLARVQPDNISQQSYGADEIDGAGVELIDPDQTDCNAADGNSEKNAAEATVQVDIPLIIYNTPTDDYSGSGEFHHSSDWGVSGEFTTSDSTFLQSFEQSTEDKMSVSPTSARKAALRKFKDKMQNQVTSKTKKLIQNIKDKNIISKAKELAETLSQGPDLSLVSGGYLDPHQFDIYNEQMQAADAEAKLKDTNYEVPKEEKPLVDVTDLQEVTDKVKHELEDPRIFSDLGKFNELLTEWITVLNKTFHKFHVKRFAPSVIQGESLQNSETVQELSRSNDVSEHHNVETDQTTNSVDLDYPTNNKDGTTDSQAVNDTVCISEVDFKLASDNFEKILSDPDFCYLADPLRLPADLLVHVSKFAHVCFEIGCHGSILEYQKLQLMEQVSEQIGTIDKSIDCDISDSATVMNGTESNKPLCDKIGNINATDNDYESSRTVSVMTFENGNSADLDHDIVDKGIDEPIDDSLTEPKPEPNPDPITEPTSEPTTEPKTALTIEPKVQPKTEPTTGPTLNVVCDTNTSSPMNFFIRLYYPYLQVHKLHKDTLHYPEWAALVTCLQGCAIDDGERLGVKDDSIISHVLDSQHQKNGGLILLGHISRLFYTKDPNVLEACVQCYPHIQPIDVLYLCCYHGIVIETVFKEYIFKMLGHLKNIHKPDIEGCLFSNSQVRLVWLEILLGEDSNTNRLMDDKQGNPRLMSHKVERKNEQLLQQVLSKLGTYCDTDARRLMSLFYKYGYWKGILQLLKQLKNIQEHCRLILHLGDIELLSDSHPLGYLPSTLDDWEDLLVTYKEFKNSGNQEADSELSDWSTGVTWNSLAILLVKNVGPHLAVSLLKKVDVEEGALDPDFYKTCLLSSMVQKQKRLILHSMLEKVDMYLWSQRPAAVTPQLHYLLVNEERIKTESAETGDQAIQSMTAMLKADKSVQRIPLSEDPDCHWGVKTRFNMLCGCCNIPLKETVSHTQSGVLLFRCGHGFHKQCLPDRECILCEDDED